MGINTLNMNTSFVSKHVIHPYSIRLLIATPSTDKHKTILKKKWKIEDEEENLCSVYRLNYKGWATFIIVFKIEYIQTLTYGMLAHEAQHVVDYTLNSIGHIYDPENNEVGCYLIEWVTNTIFQHFIDQKILHLLSAKSKIIKKDGESN